MHLTKEEERIYDGEQGWANQICMKILVRLGELFDADRLIAVDSAHVSGVSYKTLGDAPIDFLKALANADASVRTKATLNPQSHDQEYIRKRLPRDLCEKQSKVSTCFERMGFTPSLTCTPYYSEAPKKDSHLAWSESSAVVYANSISGAWTNREGGPSALAAAVIGKTPNYGMHKAENRHPKVQVKLDTPLRNEAEFGALGAYLGRILEDKIPVIQGLQNPSKANLKQLGAALASTGMVNMFYFRSCIPHAEKMAIEARDIRQELEKLSTAPRSEPDLVFIGCPHCSPEEIRQIADSIGGEKIADETEVWICTSRHVKEHTQRCVERIEKSGCHMITDTCAVVTWTDKLGIETIMTNSAKTAHYAPTLNNAKTILAPLEECLKAALKR